MKVNPPSLSFAILSINFFPLYYDITKNSNCEDDKHERINPTKNNKDYD